MRIAYLDCVGGISGDMFVGALLDAGWSEEAFRHSVAWLGAEIAGLEIETRRHASLRGRGIVVRSAHAGHGDSGHHHHGAEHHHRGLKEVMARVGEADLDARVHRNVSNVFRRLAEAEGHAHGASPDEVHFHEVGAVDAMVDVIATCQGLADLGIAKLHVSTLPVGRGTIEAAHGRIPLPAPATAYLLRGADVQWAGEGERTTPTGAALATTLGVQGMPPPMRVERVGVGAGSRSLPDVPNIARLFVGEAIGEAPPVSGAWPGWGWEPGPQTSPRWGAVVELSTQIDDASAEELAVWADGLRKAGALDVFYLPITMKKGRPGTLLVVVARASEERHLTEVMLEETSTLGVRRTPQWRREAARRMEEVQTPYGRVPVKLAFKAGHWVGKPESATCRELSETSGVPYRDVWRAALVAIDGLADSAD